MSLTADVAVGAAERVERSAGPGAGLAVWRRLAFNAGGVEIRGRAILGGLRCAVLVRDFTAIRDLTQLWQTVEVVDVSVWDGVFGAFKEMWRAGLGVCATDLAHAEVRRSRTARALYMYARALDVAGDPKSAAAFGEALAQAEKEGAASLVRACRVRRAVWLAVSAETVGEAIEEAKRVSTADATPAERLVLARVLLRSPSRFGRASALGLLDDIVTGTAASTNASTAEKQSAEATLRRAVLLAARHADDMADDITPLEVDRLVALFSREPIAKETARVRDIVRAIARLARAKAEKSEAELEGALADAARADPELARLHQRARDILRGRYETYESSSPSSHPQWTALLDAVVAMRDNARPRTAHALRRLAESAERGERLPPQVWTVAQAALGVDDAEVRSVAGRLAASMTKTTTAAPPRGWLGLASALAACGMEEVATTARRAAALAKEPGAVDALALTLTRSGWQLALAGERALAIARLREAKALSEQQGRGGDGAKAPPPPPAPPRGAVSNPST